MSNEEISCEELVALVKHNPSYEALVSSALLKTQKPIDRLELAQNLAHVKKAGCLQTPQQILTLLVKYGALNETILIDGKPYQGNAAAFQEDEHIPENAIISYQVQRSEKGACLCEALKPKSKIQRLFLEHPEHVSTYQKVLAFVDVPGGRAMTEIDKFLREDENALKPNPRTGLPTIYPVYYTTALEDAGAIMWNQVWHITDEGRRAEKQ